MRSPHGYIVRPDKDRRYDNTKNIGGFEMITSVSEEDHRFSNRLGIVVEVPFEGDIKVGDTLLVHHNVFKYYNDIKGKRKSGKSYLKDNLFLVEPDQFFMYKNENGWNTYDKYCFVKPIKGKDSFIKKVEEPLMGEMKYANDYLKGKGVNNGDIVFFKPDSEYEFNVDGEKLYRIYDHMIVAKCL